MDHGKNECWVNNKNQKFNNFNASYEDFKTKIPSPLNGKDQVASHAKYIEFWNRDPNYIGEDNEVRRASIKDHKLVINVLLGVVIFLVMGIAFGSVFFLEHSKSYSFQRDGPYKIRMQTDQYEEEKDDCHNELWWKWQSVDPNYPTPECDKLQLMGVNPTDP
ncbi:hypothetical protein Tco_1414311 [Tanacetum coccineum]